MGLSALVKAFGFLALLLVIGAMFVFAGLGANTVASVADRAAVNDSDQDDGGASPGAFPIFLGVLCMLLAVGLYIAKNFR